MKNVKGAPIEHIDEIKQLAADIMGLVEKHTERLGLDFDTSCNHVTIASSMIVAELAKAAEQDSAPLRRIKLMTEAITINARSIFQAMGKMQ